jgi:apolipoprotein N-acyltransferase
MALGLPDWSVPLAGWVALVPLLIALRGAAKPLEAMGLGYLAGFVGFFAIVGWLYSLGPYTGVPLPWGYIASTTGAVMLAGYLALYVMLFALLVVRFAPRAGAGYVVGVAVFWTACEWMRSWMLTGFPWGSLGYTQWNFLPAAQLASLGGVSLVGFLLAVSNAAIAEIWRLHREGGRLVRATLSWATVVVVALGYGAVSLWSDRPSGEGIRVAVVPGNIPQNVRWSRGSLESVYEHYLALLQRAVGEKPELVVMPETSVMLPYLPAEQQAQFGDFLRSNRVSILFGMPKLSARGTLREGYNAAVLMSPDAKVVDEYYKQHLVPFGEYIPFRQFLPRWLTEDVIGIADYNFGPGSNVMTLPRESGTPLRVGVPICFESVFPNISREFALGGANALAVLTNDGWYDGTSAIGQHYAIAVFRAIETRRAVIRAANRGISAFIEPTGRIQPQRVQATDQEGIIVGWIPLRADRTLFVRVGDWVSAFCVLGTLAFVALGFRRRVETSVPAPEAVPTARRTKH